MNDIRALILVCTRKPAPEEPSALLLGAQILDALHDAGADGEIVRVAEDRGSFGVCNHGAGGSWPYPRAKVLEADVVVLCSTIWRGQPASSCQEVLSRLDAEIVQTHAVGRMPTHGKVAAIGVVRNEDGARHIGECLQALDDAGLSVTADARTFWVGEVTQPLRYRDPDGPPVVERSPALTR
jgi:multimeric flavodoxin WrbA